MMLNDNDPKLDHEITEIMEELMREHLSGYPDTKWFSLRSLYEKLEIKFTVRRLGSLDSIISRTLNEWNWHYHNGYWGPSYVRRNKPSAPVAITLADGTTITTSDSWPPYRLPAPTPEQIVSSEGVRARIMQHRNSSLGGNVDCRPDQLLHGATS